MTDIQATPNPDSSHPASGPAMNGQSAVHPAATPTVIAYGGPSADDSASPESAPRLPASQKMDDAWLADQFERAMFVAKCRNADEPVVMANLLRGFANRVLQTFGNREGMREALDIAFARDRASKQADKLWCVNVQGPDDVHAMPSRLAAMERANELNVYFGQLDAESKTPQHDPIMRAVVIEWPHSPESHAAALAKAGSQ